MAENAEQQTAENKEEVTQPTQASGSIKLNGLFAFKKGMATVYDEGEAVPVTVLQYEPWRVSQIKTPEKDGYTAVQVAWGKKSPNKSRAAGAGHAKKAGFETAPQVMGEVRQDLPEGVQIGQKVDIESLAKGDTVTIMSRSKGRGFAGVMKRWNFGGGPASHGSGFHRRPGSIGNRTWPGRVMPGRKMAGHFGDERITVRNVKIVDVLPEEGAILVKGPVPGGNNTLVKLMKV